MGPKLTKINPEALLIRHHDGIKFISSYNDYKSPNKQTVESLSHLPFSFYLLDGHGRTNSINKEGAIICGFNSAEESIGKSIVDVGTKESAEKLIENCHSVITNKSSKIFEEIHIRKDGYQHQFLSIKYPWYNEKDEIIGICGFSIALGRHSLAESLTILTEIGIFNHPTNYQQSTFILNNTMMNKLTKREMDCLHYTVRGFSAKRIARVLNISFRTVEEYIANIRFKFGASSKAELIDMVLE